MSTFRKWLYGASGLICLGSLLVGMLTGHPGYFAPALVAASCLGALWVVKKRLKSKSPSASLQTAVDEALLAAPEAGPPVDTGALVDEMLAQGRYALLLRPQIAPNLSTDQLQQALEAFEDETAFVPSGQICIGLAGKETDPTENDVDLQNPGEVVEVDDFRLDRYCVTNQQYLHFVASGGYTQAALWDAQVWPAVVEFVDRTGMPGPRFWQHGKYAAGEADHPVVGISWYEAAAYSRWLGKRLPTDPEWEKAGSWPVQLDESVLIQRRYPWGDLMERERANLWGSGPGHTAPVDKFPEGASPCGVQQLIGNTWEWTSSDFASGPYQRRGMTLITPMKSVRGGAFDTYFDHQATCQFQSGENPVNRKHNISFRCAVSTCDLAEAVRRLSRLVETDRRRAEALNSTASEEVCV